MLPTGYDKNVYSSHICLTLKIPCLTDNARMYLPITAEYIEHNHVNTNSHLSRLIFVFNYSRRITVNVMPASHLAITNDNFLHKKKLVNVNKSAARNFPSLVSYSFFQFSNV